MWNCVSASRSKVSFSVLVPEICCSKEQFDFVLGEGFVRLWYSESPVVVGFHKEHNRKLLVISLV